MNTTVESARAAVTDRLAPALDSLEQHVHDARRVVARGRRAAENLVEDTTRRIRRRPLRSMAVAASAGALVGCLIGVVLGWNGRHTRPGQS